MDSEVKEYRKKVLSHIKNELDNKKGNLLDVGCGNCNNAVLFIERGLSVSGIDIYQHENAKKILGKNFRIGSILKIPYKDNFFDYVFANDVLHHIDEKEQSFIKHVEGLKEMLRVCKPEGKIIIIEANRYNPLFYLHMVLLNKHNHFTQSYFKKLAERVFLCPKFIFFEAHFYPKKLKYYFKLYEAIIESLPFLRQFIAYNVSIAKKI